MSSEYPTYKVSPDIALPAYIKLLFRTNYFQRMINGMISGASGRKRVQPEQIEAIEVPFPSLSIQHTIISRWENAQKEIIKRQKRSTSLRADIEAYFFKSLGLVFPTDIAHATKCLSVGWKDFQRWSVSYNQAARAGSHLSRGKYPVYNLGSVLELVQYGTSEKANTEGKGIPILRMNNIVDGILITKDLKHIELPKREITRLLLQDGDILFNRTNSKELVGKCAVFHEKDDYVFASYLIRLRVNSEKILPDFLAFTVNSQIGRMQIDALSRQIIGQANVNTDELRSLQIPLPPLSVQCEILKGIEEGRASIERERRNADYLAATAKQEIEEMILGTRPVPEMNGQQQLSA